MRGVVVFAIMLLAGSIRMNMANILASTMDIEKVAKENCTSSSSQNTTVFNPRITSSPALLSYQSLDSPSITLLSKENILDVRKKNQTVSTHFYTNFSTYRTWDWAPEHTLEVDQGGLYVFYLRFSPNGKWIVSADSRGGLYRWNAASGGPPVQTIKKRGPLVYSLAFNLDGSKFLSSSVNGVVEVWNVNSNGFISQSITIDPEVGQVFDFSLSPDQNYIVIVGDLGMKIWNVEKGEIQGPTRTGVITRVRFAPNGKTIATATKSNNICLFKTEGLTEISSFAAHTDLIGGIEFSPDGTQLVSASYDNTLKVWNYENDTLTLAKTFGNHHNTTFGNNFAGDVDSLYALKFNADGTYLGVATDKMAMIWLRQNNSYYTYQNLSSSLLGQQVLSIDISPDGNRVASGGVDKTVVIWNAKCKPGYYGNERNCTLCPPGTYQDEGGMGSCIPCAAGTFNQEMGAFECELCSPGTYQPLQGKTQCEECRAGGYCDVRKVGTCDGGFTACPLGMFSSATRMYNDTSCLPCPQGTSADNKTGLEACFECPKGTYQDKEGQSICKVCNSGSIQSRTGQSKCEICPSGTYPDQSRFICLLCPYRLGSEENSDKCPFCADEFYLKVPTIKPENLTKNPANFCLPCPLNAHCGKNTTIETIGGPPGFWRDSIQTSKFYECNNNAGACLGGTVCARGHSGVRCEVCVDKNKYFDSSKGECTNCPSFLRLGIVTGIVVGICILFFIMKKITPQFEKMKRFSARIYYLATTIGFQAKIKVMVSFYQVINTFQPIYGVHMHSAFLPWFKVLNVFNFGLAEIFNVPPTCFGSMSVRLAISAGWPYVLAIMVVCVTFIYTIDLKMEKLQRKESLAKFLSRSLHGVIIVFYFVLPSVSQQIFDARTCKAFLSNDSKDEFSSYLIVDWSVRCENGDLDYESITQVFWALFALWPVAIPVFTLGLLLYIRPSVRSDSITPLAQACRFLWIDYDQRMMFWEVIDMVRKISLTGLIVFLDTEGGSEKTLRLIIATGICIVYGTILSRARPYKRKDDLELAIVSNLLLTCCFLVGIIIHQCKEEEEEKDEENRICMKLFGIPDSYNATAIAVILTAAMLASFVLFILILSINEFRVPCVRLVSTNDKPRMIMPEEYKYHIFMSHTWKSGQDKVHKIARMLKLYLSEVRIWLDVDQLDNLGDLESFVSTSAHFVLFYSEGYFNSFNCRREVLKAMEAEKPITVLYEIDDDLGDNVFVMKDKLRRSWLGDPNADRMMDYVFAEEPIMWITDGTQFTLESVKLVVGRLLNSLPFYKRYPSLLDAGLKIDHVEKPIQLLLPLDILFCSTNIRAPKLAERLAEECEGNAQACEIDVSNDYLQDDKRDVVMLVYLNEDVFQIEGDMLCESLKHAMEKKIRLVLVHERDTRRGGCPFRDIIAKTPKELMRDPHNIYSQDIAISLYTEKEYEIISICQLLRKIGGKPVHGRNFLKSMCVS